MYPSITSRKAIRKTLAALILATGPVSPAFLQADTPAVVHQLRIYEIPRENNDVFHDRFHKHAMRIMDKYDFNIVSTWETEYDNKTEFAYLLEWPDEKAMKAQWEKFMADQEWKNIKKKTGKTHGRFVNAIEDRTLTLTSYSPTRVLKQ